MKKTVITLAFALITSCGSEAPKKEKPNSQYNISVLLDLSSRIDTIYHPASPHHYSRDMAAIWAMGESFKERIEKSGRGTLDTRDKFRIFFHPEPQDANLASIAAHLQVDMALLDPKSKKRTFTDLLTDFEANLRPLYHEILSRRQFEGSDIWGFFRNDVKRKCVEKDSVYRNILVILTDGYMYWRYDRRKEANRFNYIEREEPHLTRFRDHRRLREEFDALDYGFIRATEGLQNLEVLVIGLDAPKEHPEDLEILTRYWEKWLKEMEVKRYAVIKTEFPVHTARAIAEFLK